MPPEQHQPAQPADEITAQVTIWYDGACPLCLREIGLLRRMDKGGRICFIDISGPDAICPLDRGEMLAKFHAREAGQIYVGAAAFAAMWRAIPLLRPLGIMAKNRWILKCMDWLYLRFLKIRPGLQKLLR